MADPYREDGRLRARRRPRSHSGLDDKSYGVDEIVVEHEDWEEPVRVERLDRRTATHRRSATLSNMPSESHATLPKSTSSRRKKEHHRTSEDTRHRRRRRSVVQETDHVYEKPVSKSRSSHINITETRSSPDEELSESEESPGPQPVVSKASTKKRKIKVVYITEEEARRKERPRRTKESSERVRDSEESIHRSRPHQSRRKSIVEPAPPSPTKRSHSTRQSESTSRPSIKRSHTTASHSTSHRSRDAPSLSTANSARRPTFLGSFFSPGAPHHHHHHDAPPPRLVECLTCLSDDIPVHKSAKLKCGHRMCHSCLKRIFRLSVTDPQHMPPKCCASDHIPLKHVDKLFDISFKKNWNKKFAEYTTKNRIYCPARRCGEWIKPQNIHVEGGRKYGKCSRCKTKVCCLCNCKWHGTKECPKDEETNKLLETAKQAGWQRCYNCRTMVELKEGCNHMTCRCTAEFCMICGLKWKSCNCPWFNYDVVENDRLNHMRVAEDIPVPGQQDGPNRLRRPRAPTYHDEMFQRRRQERQDEALARRLQSIAIDDHDDDYQGGIGDIHGIGNNAGHFMNQDYVRSAHNVLNGAFNQANAAADYVMGINRQRGIPIPLSGRARGLGERYPMEQSGPPPPPLVRRPSVREPPPPRSVERVVPMRTSRDYATEAAIHAPTGRATRPVPAEVPDAPKSSVLAGLGRKGRGSNRVGAWAAHVEPGVVPAEGVLSVVD